ncbi:MAG: hypothetical protein CL828_03910 [Crocinitomicaceae bacterium]|nr:hypothetical protein [Crocinitomicaceae bacterium]
MQRLNSRQDKGMNVNSPICFRKRGKESKGFFKFFIPKRLKIRAFPTLSKVTRISNRLTVKNYLDL